MQLRRNNIHVHFFSDLVAFCKITHWFNQKRIIFREFYRVHCNMTLEEALSMNKIYIPPITTVLYVELKTEFCRINLSIALENKTSQQLYSYLGEQMNKTH